MVQKHSNMFFKLTGDTGHRSTGNVTHFSKVLFAKKGKGKKGMALQHGELQRAGPSLVLVRCRHLEVSVKAEHVSRSRWRPNTDRHETVHTKEHTAWSRLSELSTWGNKWGKTRWPKSKYHALGQKTVNCGTHADMLYVDTGTLTHRRLCSCWPAVNLPDT